MGQLVGDDVHCGAFPFPGGIFRNGRHQTGIFHSRDAVARFPQYHVHLAIGVGAELTSEEPHGGNGRSVQRLRFPFHPLLIPEVDLHIVRLAFDHFVVLGDHGGKVPDVFLAEGDFPLHRLRPVIGTGDQAITLRNPESHLEVGYPGVKRVSHGGVGLRMPAVLILHSQHRIPLGQEGGASEGIEPASPLG